MSESKHTPGPWCIDGFNTSNVIRKTSDAGTAGTWDVLARVQGENWRADALLVAAAPDLLRALHWFVYTMDEERLGDDIDDYQAGMSDARSAIAKAEGA